MGEEQTVGYEELLASSRAAFEASTDFTLAVEEEFALLDPATLELVNRFEELQAAAQRHRARAAPRRRADRLGGRGAHRPVRDVRGGSREGRRAARAAARAHRRRRRRAARRSARIRGAAGRTSASSTRRTTGATTSCCATSSGATTRSACTSTSAINGADRAIQVTSALRNYLPELLALSASSPFVEGVYTHLHSARTQIFTRMFPRCGIPDALASWDEWESYVRFLYETGSVTEHTQMWWSVRPHLAFPTVEIRICDAQPDLAEARSLAALCYSLTARIARAHRRGRAAARPGRTGCSRRTSGARSAGGSRAS